MLALCDIVSAALAFLDGGRLAPLEAAIAAWAREGVTGE
jgi:hypothetical protein